jgi:mono/diheme cytochrome c family protein
MNFPNLGITADDPGKCVLGTVPVEADGSAYFRAPSGVTLFFQALDEHGLAAQTMRSAAYVQPGQTVGCIGCHEPRTQAAPVKPALAARRAPSKILPGPAGSWPFRFDQLVQPVLDRHCVSCHNPGAQDAPAAKLDLTAVKAYDSLVRFGKPSLQDQVWAGYRQQGASIPGEGLARRSALWALLTREEGHYDVKLDAGARERLIVWMDTYAQKLGAFGPEQERRLEEFRRACAGLLAERSSVQQSAREQDWTTTAAVPHSSTLER